jgi:hypothetical protein
MENWIWMEGGERMEVGWNITLLQVAISVVNTLSLLLKRR